MSEREPKSIYTDSIASELYSIQYSSDIEIGNQPSLKLESSFFNAEKMQEVQEDLDAHSDWTEKVLANPENHFYWTQASGIYSSDVVEIERMQRKLRSSAMIATVNGEQKGLRALGALLVTMHINPKLVIREFLKDITEGQIGDANNLLPEEQEIVGYVGKIRNDEITLRPRLQEYLT